MSESFDLSGFVALATVNSKNGEIKAAGKAANPRPTYDLKYLDSDFKVSADTWKKLDLDNHSLQPLVNPATNQVALKVVGDKEGKIFKNNLKEGQKKFHSFRASDIESALVKLGLIIKTVKVKGVRNEGQYLSFKEVSEGVYLIVGSTSAPKAEAAPVETQVAAETQTTAPAVPETTSVVDEVPYTDQIPSADELTVDASTFAQDTQVVPEQSKQIEDENFDEQF